MSAGCSFVFAPRLPPPLLLPLLPTTPTARIASTPPTPPPFDRWRKVGWIFAQSTKEREFIMSAEEVCQMAAVQDEMGQHAVTALVATWPGEDGQPEVHFEVGGCLFVCVCGGVLCGEWGLSVGRGSLGGGI